MDEFRDDYQQCLSDLATVADREDLRSEIPSIFSALGENAIHPGIMDFNRLQMWMQLADNIGRMSFMQKCDNGTLVPTQMLSNLTIEFVEAICEDCEKFRVQLRDRDLKSMDALSEDNAALPKLLLYKQKAGLTFLQFCSKTAVEMATLEGLMKSEDPRGFKTKLSEVQDRLSQMSKAEMEEFVEAEGLEVMVVNSIEVFPSERAKAVKSILDAMRQREPKTKHGGGFDWKRQGSQADSLVRSPHGRHSGPE